jgi:phospholipid/cholesterol/gamma-HCH transport system substrate-binding protein
MQWRRTLVKLVLIFVLPCGAITIYLFFAISNVQSLKIGPFQLLSNEYTLHATFDDITGMLPNDNVKVAGVAVGKVTKTKIVDGRAAVTFKVKNSVKLSSDTSAAVRWRNLLGQRYLYLYPGSASTVLRKGGTITQTRAVVDLGELFNRLGPIVKAIDPQQVNTFLDAVVGGLDGNEQKLRQSIDALAALSTTLGSRDEAIGRLVGNLDTVAGTLADRDREIRTILDNLVAISTTFNENTDVLDQSVTQLKGFSENFGTLLTDNRAQIDRTINNLTTIVQLVQSKLPTLDHAVGVLDDAAKRLFNASRFGEWLNQDIPCGFIQAAPGVGVPVNCMPLTSPPSSGGVRRGATGVDALRRLMGVGGATP